MEPFIVLQIYSAMPRRCRQTCSAHVCHNSEAATILLLFGPKLWNRPGLMCRRCYTAACRRYCINVD